MELGGCGHGPHKPVEVFNQTGVRKLCTGQGLEGMSAVGFVISMGEYCDITLALLNILGRCSYFYDLNRISTKCLAVISGSGPCWGPQTHQGDLQLYYIVNDVMHVIHTFHYEDYNVVMTS